MEPSRRERSSGASPPGSGEDSSVILRRVRRRRRGVSGFEAMSDRATGVLLLFLVVFTPWAFGTTQDWSTATANGVALALGILLGARGFFRWLDRDSAAGERREGADWGLRGLGILTVLLLAYVVAGVLNARADWDPVRREFVYLREPWRWLPRSYDQGASAQAAIRYAGFAAVFWATVGWLRRRGSGDSREAGADGPEGGEETGGPSARLKVLLWVLCLNGAALALVGMLQRADGTNKLLWIVESRSNKAADAVFGPWSYRANAAQYFNLLWPVCLGFWLWLQNSLARSGRREAGRLDGPQLVLVPCGLTMAAGPIVSGSRGGALIAVALALASVGLILAAPRRELESRLRRLAAALLAGAVAAAMVAGWSTLGTRLRQVDGRSDPGFKIGTNDFSLVVRVHFPSVPAGVWYELASVPGTAGRNYPFNHAYLQVTPEGGLFGRVYGNRTTNSFFVRAPLPDAAKADRATTVALVRREGLQLYVDGVAMPGTEQVSGLRPGWNAAVTSSSMLVGGKGVLEVALVGTALGPAELGGLVRAPLSELTNILRSARSGPVAVSLMPTNVVLAADTEAEVVSRRTEPGVSWFSVRQTGEEGYLGFRRPLNEVQPVLRGQVRASFEVWNPENAPLDLGVSLDGSWQGPVKIPPRAEQTVRVALTSPRGGAPGFLEIAWVDAEGIALDDVPRGARLMVRNLQVESEVQVFTRDVRPGFRFRLGDLGDRMSGRPEIYENARRMAADYPVWGAGAGTFGPLYQLYRQPGQGWAAYAHDDWLETRITLGWVGLVGVVAGLTVLLLRSWVRSGTGVSRLVVGFWALALGGCLVHAKLDFPFQVHSVALLFVVLAAILVAMTSEPLERRGPGNPDP